MARRHWVRILHRTSGEVLAEGPRGWKAMTRFEGNWYVHPSCLKSAGFRSSGVPGVCPYKFVYVWLHHEGQDGAVTRFLGWKYILPNPLLPFIAFRVALPGGHPELLVEEVAVPPPGGRRP